MVAEVRVGLEQTSTPAAHRRARSDTTLLGVRGFLGSFSDSVVSRWENIWAAASGLSSTALSTSATQGEIASITRRQGNREHLSLPLAGVNSSIGQSSLLAHLPSRVAESSTSISSRPVVVKTYTPHPDRSRTESASRPVHGPNNALLSMPTAGPSLPSVDAFAFDGILRAIEPDINEAIDGIAEIYARTRLSLADEYGAHLPPQGEIMAAQQRASIRHSGLAIRTMGIERTLTTVTEASSSSEKLVSGGSKPGSVASGKGKATAYGSLKSIISRGRSSSHSSTTMDSPRLRRPVSASWSVTGSREPYFLIRTKRLASNQISLASVAEVSRDKASQPAITSPITRPRTLGEARQQTSRSWLASWTRPPDASLHADPRPCDAESSLRGVLHRLNEAQ